MAKSCENQGDAGGGSLDAHASPQDLCLETINVVGVGGMFPFHCLSPEIAGRA